MKKWGRKKRSIDDYERPMSSCRRFILTQVINSGVLDGGLHSSETKLYN